MLQLHELKEQLDSLTEQLQTNTEKQKAFQLELNGFEFKLAQHKKIVGLLNTQKERWLHIVTQN